jgi:hypothetical protein
MMRHSIRSILYPVLLWVLFVTFGCEKKRSPSPPASTSPAQQIAVLAHVNDVPITEDEVQFATTNAHGQAPKAQAFQDALDQTIAAELLYQQGIKLGLDRDRHYQSAVRGAELRLAATKRQEMMRRVYNSEVAAKVNVSAEDAKQYLGEHRDELIREYPSTTTGDELLAVVQNRLRDEAVQNRYQEYVKQLRNEARVTIYRTAVQPR